MLMGSDKKGPGFNDCEAEIEAIAQFVKAEMGSKDIDLLHFTHPKNGCSTLGVGRAYS